MKNIYKNIKMLKLNILIALTLFSINIVSQNNLKNSKLKKMEFNIGFSYGTQQVHGIEHSSNNLNPNKKNSPNWELMYQIGLNYKIKIAQNLFIKPGIKFQEKGAKNQFYNLLSPNGVAERNKYVIKFFLLSSELQYKFNKNSSVLIGLTYGRDVFQYIPLNVREFAVISGIRYDFSRNLGIALIFNQSLNEILYYGVHPALNTSFDLILTYNFL